MAEGAENAKRYVCPYSRRCTEMASGAFDEAPVFREDGVYQCRHVVEGKLAGCLFLNQQNLLERMAERLESIRTQGMGTPS